MTNGLSSAELFEEYQAKIRRHVLSIVHDPDEAEDLTQEVFLQAHRKLSALRDPDAVVAWLYRIATHVCYDRIRKWGRQPTPALLDDTTSADSRQWVFAGEEPRLSRAVEQAEMSGCVRSYLDNLSDDYRTAIILHDLEGLTNLEIAELLGVSLDTVKIRLHRARRKLEGALAAHCDFAHDEYDVFICEPAETPAHESHRRAATHPSGSHPS